MNLEQRKQELREMIENKYGLHETKQLATDLLTCIEAIEKSISIADDYADSGISKPIRQALAQVAGGKDE